MHKSVSRDVRASLPRLVAMLCAATVALAGCLAQRADAYIYWVNNTAAAKSDTIARANLDGSHVNTLWLTGITSPVPAGAYYSWQVSGVAVDAAHVYWIWQSVAQDPNTGMTSSTDHIGRANIDGTAVNPNLVSFPLDATGRLVLAGQYLYFPTGSTAASSDGHGAIGRVNVDGSGLNLNFVPAQGKAVDALAVAAPYIYFYEGDQIGRANLADGSGVNPSFITGTGGKLTDAMTTYGAHLYWSLAGTNCNENAIHGNIALVNLDGSGMNKTYVDTACGGGHGVAVDGSHIYWGYEGGGVGRASIDGTNVNTHFIPGGSGVNFSQGGLVVDSLTGPAATPVAKHPSKTGGCTVPNLKGLTLRRARTVLKTHHCALGHIKRQTATGRVRRGRVVGQSPRPKTRMPAGTTVGVTVTK